MTDNAFGLIYTGESNMQLRELTYSRSIAAVPFAGRYRCIDFILSSLVNTGITNVGIITQKNYHSLMDHLESGKEWDLHRKRDGLFILPPFVTRDNTGIYRGTIDALRSVLGYIRRSAQRYIVLTGSHTIYNTTFTDMLAQHIRTGADITIMYNEEAGFDPEDQYMDLRLALHESGRVTDLQLDPYRPLSGLQSCDTYVMEKTLLEYLIEEAAAHDYTDFTRDVLLRHVDSLKIYGWRRICSTASIPFTPRLRMKRPRATASMPPCATAWWRTAVLWKARLKTVCCSVACMWGKAALYATAS